MELYVGNIPKGARPSELKRLIKDSVKENIFQTMYDWMVNTGRFESGIVIAIHHANTGQEDQYRYGRISIDSSNLAKFIVENIDGASLRGENLSARAMVERNGDRRDINGSDQEDSQYNNGNCRRAGDRRRH